MPDKANLRLIGGRPVDEEPDEDEFDPWGHAPRVPRAELLPEGAWAALLVVALLFGAVLMGFYLAVHR